MMVMEKFEKPEDDFPDSIPDIPKRPWPDDDGDDDCVGIADLRRRYPNDVVVPSVGFEVMKRKRYFHRISSGQKLAMFKKKTVRFITLTTSDKARTLDISRDVDVLIKRIRRRDPTFQYWKVHTNEGNGVIHLLYTGDFIPKRWLVANWNDVHSSYIVDIRKCYNEKSIAHYLMNQYLSNQACSYTRMSMSKHWIFPGAVKRWRNIWTGVKSRFFYNPIQDKYYKNKIEILFKDILKLAIEIWNCVLYNMSFKQTTLSDYG
jgi:hypothetical protein